MKIIVTDPDHYYKTQHTYHGGNDNDLHNGRQIKIRYSGVSSGAVHYSVFVLYFNSITGSQSYVNISTRE